VFNRLHDQHPQPPASFQGRQRNRPTCRGSILDADPPAQGVNIAGRMTSRLKIDRSTGIERHQCADRERSRNRGNQAFNAIFVPYPTALKIRQLNNTHRDSANLTVWAPCWQNDCATRGPVSWIDSIGGLLPWASSSPSTARCGWRCGTTSRPIADTPNGPA
jgi:hypothetical protein